MFQFDVVMSGEGSGLDGFNQGAESRRSLPNSRGSSGINHKQEVMVRMKRFMMVLAVVGVVLLFASYSMGFYAWAPFSAWGGASSSSGSSSGYYPASSSSSGYWPSASSSSGYSYPSASSSSSGYYYPTASSSSSGYYNASSSSSGYYPASSSSSGWYWPSSSSSSGYY